MAEEAEKDYDLLPHEEVIRLRREVEDIKTHPFGSAKEGKELLKAINRLSESMDNMTGLFQEAAEQMKLEEREAELIGKKLDPLFEQMNDLIEQNRKIAKGIIAVADMVKGSSSMPMPRAAPQPIRVEPSPLPRSPLPPGMQSRGPLSAAGVPPPMPPPAGRPGPGMPPPPPEKSKKKGLFSFGK